MSETLEIASAQKSDPSMTVQVFTEWDQVIPLYEDLSRFQESQGVYLPNARPDRFVRVGQFLGRDVTPYVVVTRCPDGITGLLLGRISAQRIPLRIGYLTIKTPRHRVLDILHGGFIAKDATASSLLVTHLQQTLSSRHVDAITLNRVSLDCLNAVRSSDPLRRSLGAVTLGHVWYQDVAPGVSDPLRQAHSGRTLRSWRKKERRLEETLGGPLEFRVHSSVSCLDDIFRDASLITDRSYHKALAGSFAKTDLWRDIARLELTAGRMRAFLLCGPDQPIAFAVGTLAGRTLALDAIGYDARYSRWSPGLLLLLHVTEHASQENCVGIDHGYGDSEHKAVLCQRNGDVATARLYAWTLRGAMCRLLETCVAMLSRSGAHLAQKLGVAKRLKRLWRGRLAGKKNTVDGEGPEGSPEPSDDSPGTNDRGSA